MAGERMVAVPGYMKDVVLLFVATLLPVVRVMLVHIAREQCVTRGQCCGSSR